VSETTSLKDLPVSGLCPVCKTGSVAVEHLAGHWDGEVNGFGIQNMCKGKCSECDEIVIGFTYHDGKQFQIQWH